MVLFEPLKHKLQKSIKTLLVQSTILLFNVNVARSMCVNIMCIVTGDAMSYINNMKFRTKDRDNEYKCAASRGGWWYNACSYSELNYDLLKGKLDWFGQKYIKSKMMTRQIV